MNLNKYLYECLNKKLYMENNNKLKICNYPHKGYGKIIYSPSAKNKCDPTWAILKCEEDIVNYYKWFLLNKGVKLEGLMWGSHISIVRGEKWDKIEEEFMDKWKYNDEQMIEFYYGDLVTNGVHWWLEVKSQDLENIRKTLGLKPHPDFGFHLTIGKISEFR